MNYVVNMFCYKCGLKIDGKVNFCPVCGASISQSNISLSHKSSSNFDITKRYYILGNELVFSGEFIKYNDLRSSFEKEATETKLNFASFYFNKIRTYEDVYGIAWEKFNELIDENVEKSVYKLIKYNVDYIDKNIFYDLLGEKIYNEENLKYVLATKEKVEEYEDSIYGYTKYKKTTRSRWQGGGFGVKGAIKGALTASAMNLGMDAIHGIGDTIANSSNKNKIQKIKNAIVEDEKLRNCYFNAIYNICCEMFECVYAILVKENKIPLITFDSKRTTAKVNNAVALYKKGQKSKDETIAQICRCIEESPYNMTYYKNIYILNSQSISELKKLTHYFGIEKELEIIILS